LSVALTWAVLQLLNLLLLVPRDTYEKFNKKLITRHLKKINPAYTQFTKSMLIRYIIYFLISVGILGFTFAYVLIFCTIYSSAALSWFLGCIVSWLILYILIQFVFPFVHTVIRTIAHSKRCRSKRGMKYIYLSAYYIL
jgi:hypothetical protein